MARIERHDALVNLVASECAKRGWETMVEPNIVPRNARETALAEGVRARSYRPDLVLWKDRKAVVVDAQVVYDQASLTEAHLLKVDKYSSEATTGWVKRETNSDTCSVTSLTMNWRGAMATESYRDLREILGLPKSVLEVASLRTIDMGVRIWLHHRNSTWRVPFGW